MKVQFNGQSPFNIPVSFRDLLHQIQFAQLLKWCDDGNSLAQVSAAPSPQEKRRKEKGCNCWAGSATKDGAVSRLLHTVS